VALTKIDLVEKICSQLEFSKKASVEVIESVLSILKSTLESGEDVNISGFGKFKVMQKKDRKGRNPATGETITLKARKIVNFKPSAVLRKSVNT
jgi:integration host factor subunit alpha